MSSRFVGSGSSAGFARASSGGRFGRGASPPPRETLTAKEYVDLVAYLLTLKGGAPAKK